MNRFPSTDNLNYINSLEPLSNSFSQSIHSTLFDKKINSLYIFKKKNINKKRTIYSNKILNIKINKILRSQKLTNKRLECISSILMSLFSNSNLYDYNHFEINYISNKKDDFFNDNKSKEENLYNSFSQNYELNTSSNKYKTEDLNNSLNKNKIEDLEVSNDNIKYNNLTPNQVNYNNKFSNIEINLNKYKILPNKSLKKNNDEEENKIKEKEDIEIKNQQINGNKINSNNINEDINELSNFDKNKDNDNISLSNYSEEKYDNRKISFSQQSNYSENHISKPLSSNMIKSSQDRFKKIRGFNFKNNIKNKKSFQQKEIKEISKIINRQNEDIQLSLNNKENIKKNIDLKQFFNKSIDKNEEQFDIITNEKYKENKENE